MSRMLSAALLAASVASAQQLSVAISPNPAPLGAPITISAEAAYGPLWTPGGCLVTSVRSGGPNGPVVRVFGCTFLAVAIPVCGTGGTPRTTVWNQLLTGNGSAAPGDYWVTIAHSPAPFSAITTEAFCVTIEAAATDPKLTASAAPQWGSYFAMNLDAPLYPGSIYAVALSGSTNVGIPLSPTELLCLDFDALFNFSFPAPLPPFINFQGGLDAAGQAPGLGIQFPPNPGLTCFPFHAQAVILDISGALVATNGLSLTVR